MENRRLICAAQYLRMSTEHQQYSIENQRALIERYAQANDLSLVATYTDAGKSGLSLKNRPGLRRLIQDVVGGAPPFETILVYDVTRWGRFQDIDEPAHYEFICRSAGIPVHYCAEPFKNDGSVADMIIKALKRLMAGEYSRDLSAKVYEGARNLASLGFRQGGTAGYGYRRLLVSMDGKPKGQLLAGQRKCIQEDHVVLAPGPADEIHWVREIFRLFTQEQKNPLEIAKELNACGVTYRGSTRREWYRQAVDRILKDPKYVGCNVYGRSTQKLGIPRTKLPSSKWTVVPRSWPGIVDPFTFVSAQQTFANQTIKTNAQLIEELAVLLADQGKLSERIVVRQPDLPSQATYRARFGSMSQAFALAGYDNSRLLAIKIRQRYRVMRDGLLASIVAASDGRVSIIQADGHWRPRLHLLNRSLISVYVLHCFETKAGELRWFLNAVPHERECITFVARLSINDSGFQDYFVLPNLRGRTRWTLTIDDEGLRAGRQLLTLSEFTRAVDELDL